MGHMTGTRLRVQATGETVNTTCSEMSRVIDKEQAQDLALNSRNYMQLVSLVLAKLLKGQLSEK